LSEIAFAANSPRACNRLQDVSPLISSTKRQTAQCQTGASSVKCRICGAPSVTLVGEVEYYTGFPRAVHDCPVCLCRFTEHDNSIYEVLHASGAVSYYNDYRDLAAKCKSLFDGRDLAGLKAYLRQISKYRFIIDELERVPHDARILEVGCSRGYLTSAFILEGRKILGADISQAALDGAQVAFGDHFVQPGEAVEAAAPYDIIYHVGMIGCVSDPLGLTRSLLAMLKPGGSLLFNAPNLRSCYLRNQLWLDSAPPPDVVTLFSPGFWSRQMPELVDVCEVEEILPADLGLKVGLRKLFKVRWNPPQLGLSLTQRNGATPSAPIAGRVWDLFERAVTKGGRLTGLARFAAPQPTEFGLFIRMTRTASASRRTEPVAVPDACCS